MNKFPWIRDNVAYYRIRKDVAKKYFEKGFKIYSLPVNIRFDNPYYDLFVINKDIDDNFEHWVNSIMYYNTHNYNGRYLKYFMKVSDIENE